MSENRSVDLMGVASLYTHSLKEYGATPKGVGWRDEASQELRFAKLLSVIDRGAVTEPLTINELGCGYGALADSLVAAGLPLRLFRGYDISAEMLQEARRQCTNIPAEWVQSAMLDQTADYCFTSGIFNVKLDHDEKAWRGYVESVIDNLKAFSRQGFAFNLLSTYVDYRENHLFYGDPLYFFDYCKRTCSRYVTLLHDYPLYEWTITVRA
jgi:SAM-dependent methyltransferase